MRRTVLFVLLLALVTGASAAPARAADSDAPPGSPPNWLPPDEWVNNLWLPFDEPRLYEALRMTRGGMFRWLRDDSVHDIAQLAARRGMTVEQLAGRLVASRRARLSPRTYRIVLDHTRRVIRQGHLAQHMLFHVLHQTAVPNRARAIFGTDSNATYLALRRQEISPLEIGELFGRSRVRMRRDIDRVLAAAQSRGVRAGLVSRQQARTQLDRQQRSIPRWLGQGRYNGPLPARHGVPIPFAADFAKRATISADGGTVVFDGYRARIPEAAALGEIHVVGRRLGTARTFAVSPSSGVRWRKPRAAYNSVLSADGSAAAFETAESTYPIAKRVGQMSVLVRDMRAGRTVKVSSLGRAPGAPSRSAYNPTISGDGRYVAFEAMDAGAGAAASANAVWVADRHTGTQTQVASGSTGAAYLPRLSGDGTAVAYVTAGTGGRSRVEVRALPSGRVTLASRADGAGGAPADGDAFDPAISRDGSVVAFASQARNLGARGSGTAIVVRDLRAGTTEVVGGGGASGSGAQPAVSADGRYVVYITRRLARGGSLRSQVWRYDRARRTTVLVSRAGGQVVVRAGGYQSQPALSADGARVVFTSTGSNLGGGKPAGLAGIYVRDLVAGTTTLVSTHRRNPRRARVLATAASGTVGARSIFACDLTTADGILR